MIEIGNDWDTFLSSETCKPYFVSLWAFLEREYAAHTIYPDRCDIFNAFYYTPLSEVKVVILGQDPYINAGEAHGAAFSVSSASKIPPSLRNIFKELVSDIGCDMPTTGHLVPWCRQGVLLLNTVLSVRVGQSKSHANKGWEQFTTAVLAQLNAQNTPIVFMLWGNDAKKKAALLNNPRHVILQAAHPSPLARGQFFGCRHFSLANEFLERNGVEEICWRLKNDSAAQI